MKTSKSRKSIKAAGTADSLLSQASATELDENALSQVTGGDKGAPTTTKGTGTGGSNVGTGKTYLTVTMTDVYVT